jgi:hypothetical protein
MDFKPEKYIGKFGVVTKPKTFIKAEIHKILAMSDSNYFVRVDGVERVAPITDYKKSWVEWFDTEEEARTDLPIIERGRQAEEELDDEELLKDFWRDQPLRACCVIDDLPDIYGRDGVLTRLIAVETADLV